MVAVIDGSSHCAAQACPREPKIDVAATITPSTLDVLLRCLPESPYRNKFTEEIVKLEDELESLKRERAMLVDALKSLTEEFATGAGGARNFSMQMRKEIITRALSATEPQATQWLREKKAESLELFATKWLPHMKQCDQQSSMNQTIHNLAVDDCIRHAFSMAQELRLAASKRKEQV
jgi:hypothetical protein